MGCCWAWLSLPFPEPWRLFCTCSRFEGKSHDYLCSHTISVPWFICCLSFIWLFNVMSVTYLQHYRSHIFYIVYFVHCDEVKNSCNTKKCTILWIMHTIFYIACTCFVVIILQSSRSRHRNFFKTCSNEVGKHTYVVVSILQNFTRFVYSDVHKCSIMLVKQQ